MSDIPPLLPGKTEAEYRHLFEETYCRKPIYTYDGICIFFRKEVFLHAFYESTRFKKDAYLSLERTQRVLHIKNVLQSNNSGRYQGWNSKDKIVDPTRMVAVTLDDFVVVLRMYLNSTGNLCGQFVTCYLADNSIDKIRRSPIWRQEVCIKALKEKGR